MPNRNQPNRAARRPETQPDESDVAAIFERRLLARGIRTDDFLDWRGSTELPAIPTITPTRFGRGSEKSSILPIAAVAAAVIGAPSDEDTPAADKDESSSTN